MTETTGVGGGRPRRPDAPQPSPRSVPEWRSFGFTVTEMTDGPARMRADATGLSVHFDDAGVTVGHERGQRQVTPWSDVRRVWVGPPAEGPTGRSVTPMEIETATGTVRLVADVDGRTSVPLAALDRCLQWWSPVVGPGTAGRSDRRHRRTGRARPARRRRTAVLVAGLVLVAAGVGLAFGLGRSGTNGAPVDASPAAPSSADQHLAQRIMLTEGDLPVGWKVDPEPSTSGDSPSQRGQAAITRAFAGCMGVGSQQAAALLGGASAWSGVRPDLWCFGKVIGGGLPVGAFGGRREVLSQLAPEGPVYQAGTLSGNPLATAAGLAVLESVGGDDYAALSRRVSRFGADLELVLNEALSGAGTVDVRGDRLEARVPVVGPLLGIFFVPEGTDSVTDYEGAAASAATGLYARFFHAMLDRGVALAPGPYEVAFPSLAHGDEELDRALDAASEAIVSAVSER